MINVLEIRLRKDKLWKGQHSHSFWMPAKQSHQDIFRKYHRPTYVTFPPGIHLWGYRKNWIKIFTKALNNPLLLGCTEIFFQICWGQLGAIYLANIYWTHTLSPAPQSALESTVSSQTCLLGLTDWWQKQTINRQTKRFGIRLTPHAMKGASSKGRRTGTTLQGRRSGKNCEEGRPEIGGVEEKHFLSEEMQANSHWESKRMKCSRKCKGENWKSCIELYIMEAI